MSLSIGDKLGPYEIIGLIGKGGMGEVYRGTDIRLGRPVAIKVSAREFSAAAIKSSNGVLRPATPIPLKIPVGELGGWSPDCTGQKLLLAPPLDHGTQAPITVVTNWEATLKP